MAYLMIELNLPDECIQIFSSQFSCINSGVVLLQKDCDRLPGV